MVVEILNDADLVAAKAAAIIAAEARSSIAERGRFIMAVSGGRAPMDNAEGSGEAKTCLGAT